eukprot:GHRR01014038.1.p1 GENE.GHRR01014038.1~~GHRR01014038.1.p1  ORF type:complete len:724 (+),score=273.34 GHRR01014038.1:1101-3272(+)
MTRKQRQNGGNVTYDLSNARNVAAFEALLENADDADPGQLPPRGKRAEVKPKREKERFFKLQADTAAAPSGRNYGSKLSSQQQLQQLLEMFQGACDPGMIADVLQVTGNDATAATEALLTLLGTAAAEQRSSAGASSSSISTYSGGATSIGSDPGSSSCSSGALAQSMAWYDLPDDVKQAILAHLPLRDLARLAHTCKDFHTRASAVRSQVHHLPLQPGLSYSALVGLVGSHPAASVVDFSRIERGLNLQKPEQLIPQVIAMHKQEAEVSLYKAVLAVAEAASTGSRAGSVKGLVLKGLVGCTDRVLVEVLSNMKGLRSLDVSHCPNLTNRSLYQLAKYKASDSSSQQDDTDKEAEGTSAQTGSSDRYSRDLLYNNSMKEAGDDQQSGWSDEAADENVDLHSKDWEPLDSYKLQQQVSGLDPASGSAGDPASGQAGSSSTQGFADAGAGPVAGSTSTVWQSDITAANPAIHDPVNTCLVSAVNNRIESLQLQASQQAAAAAAEAANNAARGLQELRLCGNKQFADDGLRQTLQGPVTKHSLAKIDVSECSSITSAGLIVPPLGVLSELHACRLQGLTQLVLHLPASHPLTILDLSNCHYLRMVDLHLARLQQLNLSACRTLYRLRVRCPSLRTLSLAQCGMLHDFHADAWLTPQLQQVNLFGCRRASGQQLQTVLQQAPKLRWISVNGCWNIASLHLTGKSNRTRDVVSTLAMPTFQLMTLCT